jgi:hypothetical protein
MTLGMYTNPNLHFPPSMDNGCVKGAPPLDVFEEGCKHWQSILVDHFMGYKLLYPIVNFIINKFEAPIDYQKFYHQRMVSSSSFFTKWIMILMFCIKLYGTWQTDL